MSEPFNFNTPITDNTTLVARYRCGEAPYAGKWFRMTTRDNKTYIPTTASEASTLFTKPSSGLPNYTLLNVTTGNKETVSISDVGKLEFGGGWTGISAGASSARTLYLYVGTGNAIQISGYLEGLTISTSYPFISYVNGTVELNSLIFDESIYKGLQVSGSLFNISGANTAGSYGNIKSNEGMYGTVTPLLDVSGLFTVPNAFAGRADSSYNEGSINNYSKGTGFLGQYAQAWVNKFPTITPTQTGGSAIFTRKTYVA